MSYLKLSPEYGCSPLWNSLDGKIYSNLDIDSSPFDEVLKSRLFDWAKNFETTLNQDYPPDSGFKTIVDEQAFETNGATIWKDILKHYSNLYKQVLFRSNFLNKLYSNLDEYENELKNSLKTSPERPS